MNTTWKCSICGVLHGPLGRAEHGIDGGVDSQPLKINANVTAHKDRAHIISSSTGITVEQAAQPWK